MDKETTASLEKLLGRELGDEEKERLQRIQDTLRIGPNDALWAIIAAMEYPRIYKECRAIKILTRHSFSSKRIPSITLLTK